VTVVDEQTFGAPSYRRRVDECGGRARTAGDMIRRLDEREEYVHVDVDDEHIVDE